jgi:exonuclease SbcC
MIPVQLILKNFLSYRDATLDFSGLHTACICGSNGAGKSSLLEAITWSIWGESRAASEDDVIHSGAQEVRVDFTFVTNGQTYRVIRSRVRGATSSLDFQLQTDGGFIPLSIKGTRVAQEVILQHIKLDYETFINSAYLRQGRADEFMLKRPAERKEILAELLKLHQYDELAERARESTKEYKARVDELERSLDNIKIQLKQKEITQEQQTRLENELKQLYQEQAGETDRLQSLQLILQQHQARLSQLTFARQQFQNLTQECDRLHQEHTAIQTQITDLGKILQQDGEIKAGYTEYQNWQLAEEAFAAKFAEHTRMTELQQRHQQQLTNQIQAIERQQQQAQAQLEAVEQQDQEICQTLTKSGEVEAALAKLAAARHQVSNLDQLQLKVNPLLQHRANLENQLHRVHATLVARLDQLQATEKELQNQHRHQPQIQQAVLDVGAQIEELEKKRVYLQRVQEKGQERRHFIERLQAHQRDYEKSLQELEQKLQMLQNPDATCPLCERPLDEHHWTRVLEKTQVEYQDTQQQFWVVREQMAVSDKEIQILRQEYREISQQLAAYDALREQRGELLAKLAATSQIQQQLTQIATEKAELERSLAVNDYAKEQQLELQQLDQQLEQWNYNQQDHALARSEVERWRWAEIKQGQIKEAIKRQAQLAARKPELNAKIAELKTRIIHERQNSPCAQQIALLSQQIAEIDYSSAQHNQIRQAVRQSQPCQLRYQQLLSAQLQYPQLQTRLQDLAASLNMRLAERKDLAGQIELIVQELEATANPSDQIQAIEQQLLIRRRQLDEKISQLGRLEQMIHQLDMLQTQYEQQQEQLQNCKYQQRVYQELFQAFGKNGIQALMIENVLPQLEAETNQLLSRLTANQLHVQFVTQKLGRHGKSTKKNAKLVDTLDILIADARGTRAYETYSGGETFRINFAIRLALAKLLSQRAGASLQLLIVDEGFGTQDREGCDRLIAAINAIASDFACILTVTHMAHLKEAFQARIEVNKTPQGSQIHLLV